MSTGNKMQALIFGASGITGWAITNSALSYPTPTTFSRVIGLTSRPLTQELSGFPVDSRLELYSNLDLSQDAESIARYLSNIKDISGVTHVYFAAYVHRGWGNEGSEQRKKENTDFISNAVKAVESVCPNLEFWTFPTGGKWYGFEFGSLVPRTTPVKESGPRIPSPYGDHIFYYSQIDELTSLSAGKSWSFADIRPDAIVGFVPNHNPMNIAEPLGLYLSLWKDLNPKTKDVPFPGTWDSYRHLQSNISSDQLGKFHIFVSLKGKEVNGKAFNIADEDKGCSWEDVWGGIAAYFGLKGVGPDGLRGEGWVLSKKESWNQWTEEKGLRKGVLDLTCWSFMTTVAGEYSTFDRDFDISEARAIGFKESVDHVKGYHIAFDRMKAAKIIP